MDHVPLGLRELIGEQLKAGYVKLPGACRWLHELGYEVSTVQMIRYYQQVGR